jgi:hypothetical protein
MPGHDMGLVPKFAADGVASCRRPVSRGHPGAAADLPIRIKALSRCFRRRHGQLRRTDDANRDLKSACAEPGACKEFDHGYSFACSQCRPVGTLEKREAQIATCKFSVVDPGRTGNCEASLPQ